MSRRRLIVAAGAALVASLCVWALARVGSDGDGGEVATVEVVRVTAAISRGTPADVALATGSLEVIAVSVADPVVATAVSPEALVGTVATASVPEGGMLAPGVFASPSAPAMGLIARLPTPGHTALAITVDATRAVGGWVQPGDRVNLLVPGVCVDESAAQREAAATGREVRCRRARYLYQAVDVLAIGSALAPGGEVAAGGGAAGPLTVILSLPPRAAQWVATWENELVLALVPPDYIPRVVDPLPTVVDRLPGELEVTLQPGCADPAAPGPSDERVDCPAEPIS